MGNHISIYDKDNNYIGYSVRGMLCGFLAEKIIRKYVPDYNFEIEESWAKLCDMQNEISPEDKVIIALFFSDNSSFDENDIPALEKAIQSYPAEHKNTGPLMHLNDCLRTIRKHGKVTYKYEHTSMAMTMTKSEATNGN